MGFRELDFGIFGLRFWAWYLAYGYNRDLGIWFWHFWRDIWLPSWRNGSIVVWGKVSCKFPTLIPAPKLTTPKTPHKKYFIVVDLVRFCGGLCRGSSSAAHN